MQSNVYEIVSDISARQEILDDKIGSLEDRLILIFEQIDSLPDLFSKIIQQNHSHQAIRTSLPTLVENISQPMNNNDKNNVKNQQTNYTYANSSSNPTEQTQKHTYLHPNDAASISTRPSWSASNLTSSVSAGKQYLTPTVLRTSSFDT
jgi:hypothetical protein